MPPTAPAPVPVSKSAFLLPSKQGGYREVDLAKGADTQPEPHTGQRRGVPTMCYGNGRPRTYRRTPRCKT